MEADVYVRLKENVSKKFRCHSKGNLIKCCESVDSERLSRSDNQLIEKYNKLKLDYEKYVMITTILKNNAHNLMNY